MSKIDTDKQKIDTLLTRGVEEVIDKLKLQKRLEAGEKLRVKLGIDPTSPNIHLGRSIPLLKLRDFQDLGHQVVLIIGDFTGLIGDTSDKESERPMLSEEIVKENLKTYLEQASKVIDVDRAEIYHNSKWLSKLGYMEIGRQADAFSINEFISRENISKRLDSGKRVSLRELLYPLMQGYDSVEVKADVEVGGTDQRFNLLAGRDVQRLYEQEPQDIVTNSLIEGLDGRKMSSSYGNTINLFDSPDDMFGKIMSLTDELIIKYFVLLTRVDMDVVDSYEKGLKEGENPRDTKMRLAFEITKIYHSEELAMQAQENFVQTFQKKEIPDDMPEFKINEGANIIDVLVGSELSKSKGDARRTIEQGGVKINDKKVSVDEMNNQIVLDVGEMILQKGKRHFLKLKK